MSTRPTSHERIGPDGRWRRVDQIPSTVDADGFQRVGAGRWSCSRGDDKIGADGRMWRATTHLPGTFAMEAEAIAWVEALPVTTEAAQGAKTITIGLSGTGPALALADIPRVVFWSGPRRP